jgi:hypothetical protein
MACIKQKRRARSALSAFLPAFAVLAACSSTIGMSTVAPSLRV